MLPDSMVATLVPMANSVSTDLVSLFWIMLVAVLAPLILYYLPKPGPPAVALLIVGGVLIGPQVLGLAQYDGAITLLSNLGLGFLMFMAGYDLDLKVFKQSEGKLAVWNWFTALAVAFGIALVISRFSDVKDVPAVTIAISCTALGTLLPILTDSGQMKTYFGRGVIANGAVGEFGPIVAVSILLSAHGGVQALAILFGFAVVAALVALLPRELGRRYPGFVTAIRSGWLTTAQTAIRITVLLLVALLVVAEDFGLDMVLGAFAAGLVVRVLLPNKGRDQWEFKLDGIAYGVFIPIFFICSGITLDVKSIIANPGLLAAFVGLILVARGLPTLYWFRDYFSGENAKRQKYRLMLYTCTSLPMIVAVTQIAVDANLMSTTVASALIGAGVITVLAFPLLAELLGRSIPADDPGFSTAEEPAAPSASAAT